MSLADRTPPTTDEYKTYRDRFGNWGRWGDEDQLGTLNHITDETRRAAATLVREGRTVSLSRPVATARAVPGPLNPAPADHRMVLGPIVCGDYIGVAYHGWLNTHIDALCHIYTQDSKLYNGRPSSEVTADGANTNSVEHWRNGIVTRGVLYDIPNYRDVDHVTVEAPVHGWELLDIAKAQGIEPRSGDAVIIRGGHSAFMAKNPDLVVPGEAPGVHASVLEFLYEHDASLLVWDLMEAPGQEQYGCMIGPIHELAIPYMGMPLLDNADLDDLAATCAELGRWEFQLVIAPLVVIGGTGSPVNPIAIF